MRSVVCFLLLLLVAACHQKQKVVLSTRDTIYCDEAYRSVMTQQEEVFEFIYAKDTVNLVFADEETIMEKLLDGSAKVAVIGKQLTKAERNKIKETDTVVPFENRIAKESIALIVAKDFSEKTILLDDLKKYLTTVPSPYSLLFDNKDNGTLKYCLRQLDIAQPLGKLYAQNSADSLVNYVSKDTKAIGFMAYARISDEYSEYTKTVFERVRLLPITFADSAGKKWTADAMQSSIATGEYPLIRPINFVNCNTKDESVRRFLNFLYDTKASRIFQKAGLIPAKPVARELIVNTGTLKNQ